jgi:hypothetical protein
MYLAGPSLLVVRLSIAHYAPNAPKVQPVMCLPIYAVARWPCGLGSPDPPSCDGEVRGRLACSYDWCAQNEDITELLTLARTMSKWEDEIVAAVLTSVTNAGSEAPSTLAKLEPAWSIPSEIPRTNAAESGSPVPGLPAIPGCHTETTTSGNQQTRPRFSALRLRTPW